MKLAHRMLIPATIIIALTVGPISHGCGDEQKTLKDKSIISVVKVVKTAVPADDNNKKEKLNSAKKKARANLKSSLDEKVENGEVSASEAEKILLEFDENTKSNIVHELKTQVKEVSRQELNFRRNFKIGLYNQAVSGKISFERAEDIYDNFVDMAVTPLGRV